MKWNNSCWRIFYYNRLNDLYSNDINDVSTQRDNSEIKMFSNFVRLLRQTRAQQWRNIRWNSILPPLSEHITHIVIWAFHRFFFLSSLYSSILNIYELMRYFCFISLTSFSYEIHLRLFSDSIFINHTVYS